MAQLFNKKAGKIGTAPGTPVFVGVRRLDEQQIDAIIYREKGIVKKENISLDDLDEIQKESSEYWLNVMGIHEAEFIQTIGNIFNLHVLQVEDILNTTQRAKFEEFDHHIYLVMKMLHLNNKTDILESEQLSIVFSKDHLISFQEVKEDMFDPVRERLNKPTAKIRKRGLDYLAYALVDAVVDQYIFVIEQFGEKIEEVEDQLLSVPSTDHLKKINHFKREINFLRKTIRPVKEMVLHFRKSESELVRKDTLPYLNDLEDHIKQATEAIEVYKDMLNDLLNIYNSSMNNKLNDILRVLTIFSVVFIPLTFLAGIYGTNFKYLPELEYRFAYPLFWFVLILIAIVMIVYFKRKRWL